MEERCYGCMQMKKKGSVCEHCGYKETDKTDPHHLAPGTVVGNQYLLGKVLGQGGFGITYIAWDTVMRTRVAVKEYFPSGYAGRNTHNSPEVSSYDNQDTHIFAENKKRFLREAESMAKLWNIPQIVRILRHFEENGTAYIAMEFIEGENLRTVLKQHAGPMKMEEIQTVLGPVMQALSAVHKAELVHRDISPDNIMVLPDNSTKLLDFGAARYVENANAEQDRNTSTQAILKHGFAPPEQYSSHGALGPWTDIYAMCATIYFCLTGKVPTEAMDLMIEGESIDWDSLPELTPQQRDVLKKGTALHARNRLKTIDELYEALFREDLSAQEERKPKKEPVQTDPPQPEKKKKTPAPAREKEPKQRKSRKPVLIGAALLAAAAAAFSLSPKSDREVQEALAENTPSAQPAVTEAATEGTGEALQTDTPFTYEITDGTVTITGYEGEVPSELSFPGEIGGMPVTGIAGESFCKMKNLCSVVIPGNISTIGYDAFKDCSSLSSVVIQKGVTAINAGAFMNCPVTSITFPDGLENIGSHAFYGCKWLNSVTIPDSVNMIGTYAFSGCSLSSVTLPQGLETVEAYAFYQNTKLTHADIPESVTRIEESAFQSSYDLSSVKISRECWVHETAFHEDCTVEYYPRMEDVTFQYRQLTNGTLIIDSYEGTLPAQLVIPETIDGKPVTRLGQSVFYENTEITSVVFPDTLEYISSYAFSGCTGLTSISIPEGMLYIGEGAFDKCSRLAQVSIPDTVTDIEYRAFNGTLWGDPWNAMDNAPHYDGDFLICGDGVLIAYKGLEEEIVIPDTVKKITEVNPPMNGNLKRVIIPDGVVSIGNYAFYSCVNLREVIIPESVTSIGYMAFDSDELESVRVPSGCQVDFSAFPDTCTIEYY